LSCNCCYSVDLPTCTHHPPGQSSGSVFPSVPSLVKALAYPQTLLKPNYIMLEFEAPGCSFVQILWGLKGQNPVQYKVDVDSQVNFGAAFITDALEAGATYSFSFQGCIDVALSPARCSPWSASVDVTARANCLSLIAFCTACGLTTFEGGKRIAPSKNYPLSLRWVLAGSQVVPYTGDPSTPYYERQVSMRPIMGD
jgi:hypothetical protein